MPAPFAMPPTVKPPARATATLGPESVVRIAFAAASPPSGESVGRRGAGAREHLLDGQRDADHAGGEHEDLLRLAARARRRGATADGDGVGLALGSRRRVRDSRR